MVEKQEQGGQGLKSPAAKEKQEREQKQNIEQSKRFQQVVTKTTPEDIERRKRAAESRQAILEEQYLQQTYGGPEKRPKQGYDYRVDLYETLRFDEGIRAEKRQAAIYAEKRSSGMQGSEELKEKTDIQYDDRPSGGRDISIGLSEQLALSQVGETPAPVKTGLYGYDYSLELPEQLNLLEPGQRIKGANYEYGVELPEVLGFDDEIRVGQKPPPDPFLAKPYFGSLSILGIKTLPKFWEDVGIKEELPEKPPFQLESIGLTEEEIKKRGPGTYELKEGTVVVREKAKSFEVEFTPRGVGPLEQFQAFTKSIGISKSKIAKGDIQGGFKDLVKGTYRGAVETGTFIVAGGASAYDMLKTGKWTGEEFLAESQRKLDKFFGAPGVGGESMSGRVAKTSAEYNIGQVIAPGYLLAAGVGILKGKATPSTVLNVGKPYTTELPKAPRYSTPYQTNLPQSQFIVHGRRFGAGEKLDIRITQVPLGKGEGFTPYRPPTIDVKPPPPPPPDTGVSLRAMKAEELEKVFKKTGGRKMDWEYTSKKISSSGTGKVVGGTFDKPKTTPQKQPRLKLMEKGKLTEQKQQPVLLKSDLTKKDLWKIEKINLGKSEEILMIRQGKVVYDTTKPKGTTTAKATPSFSINEIQQPIITPRQQQKTKSSSITKQQATLEPVIITTPRQQQTPAISQRPKEQQTPRITAVPKEDQEARLISIPITSQPQKLTEVLKIPPPPPPPPVRSSWWPATDADAPSGRLGERKGWFGNVPQEQVEGIFKGFNIKYSEAKSPKVKPEKSKKSKKVSFFGDDDKEISFFAKRAKTKKPKRNVLSF